MSFVVHVADAELMPDELDPSSVLAGDPKTSSAVLHVDDKVERGIWQITPGTVTDVETDEVFVVLDGRATIEIKGGPTLEVGPGDVCVFDQGAETVWTVHETLRKVYQITF
ncbi:MAG: hypothetical protein JWN52_6763 [Actinomycetia bacterium]|nr:hypothetical protein [Actinomycetes bacterium]